MSPLVYGLLFVVVAPLFGGLLAGADRIVSARMQGRVGPPLLQPFYDVGKLFEKETRQVNPVVEPLLLGHLGFMAAAGALVLGGTDLIFIAFVFALAALHPGADDPVHPGQEAAEERGHDDEQEAVDERAHARTTIPNRTITVRITPHTSVPARNTRAPSITPSR